MIPETTYDQHPPDREFGPTVLIVDDEQGARERLELGLAEAEVDAANSLHIIHCTSLPQALETIASTTIHVVLLDKNVGPDHDDPAQNGIEAIPAMLDIQPHLQILMVSASNDLDDVVHAMKSGACGYVTKETSDDLLIRHINRAIQVAVLTLDKIRRDRTATLEESELGGKSRIFQDTMKHGQLLAESNRPVLLLGETGTGKTAFAKWINKCREKYLKQKDRPFFGINVATLTKQLIESELFGHEKGSFTDAKEAKQGLFELAANGTLFLDEIGELPLELQAKLLTVIDEGTFMRVGGKQTKHSTPKLIFATNRDLERMVAEGSFRKDLWMRISMFPLQMPNLADRREDIPDIIRALLPRSCRENNLVVAFEDIPKDFIDDLCSVPIEGNIRGVHNQLERLLLLAPKDRRGRPILKKWRSVPGLYLKRSGTPESGHTDAPEAVTLMGLRTQPTNLIDDNFPGLSAALDMFSERIISEAITKFSKNKDIAKALKISESGVSQLMKRLRANKTDFASGLHTSPVTKEVFQ